MMRRAALKLQLAEHVPPRVMAGIFGVVWRNGSSKDRHPYIAVVIDRNHVLRFSEDDWLSDACIARICLDAP